MDENKSSEISNQIERMTGIKDDCRHVAEAWQITGCLLQLPPFSKTKME